MMTRKQFLLIKLAEEAAEIAERALKAAQFDTDEIQPGQPHTNADRLVREYKDLLTIA